MSGFLQGMIDKAKSMLEVRPPTETQAIPVNSFARDDWHEVLDSSPVLQKSLKDMKQDVNFADEFAQDLHSTFYKIDPQLTPASEMEPRHVANHEVIRELLDMQEVHNLRQHSMGDIYGSAMAMEAMQETVMTTLGKVQEAQAKAEGERQQREEQAAAQAAALQQALQQAAQDAAMGYPEMTDPNALQATMDQFAQAQAQAQAAAENSQQAANQAAQGGVNAIQLAAREAVEKADEEQQLMSAFGVEPGVLQRMPVRERIELAKKLSSNRLAQFAKLLGQFRMVQQAESRKRVINAASEVHGITQSNDLTRLTAGEYLNFADESLETLMWLRWCESMLNTYDVRGTEKLGQGPIICVVDESGSMTTCDVAGGSREAWAKALSLAMLEQARRRKRDFIYIGFSSPGRQREVRFPNGESSMEKVIDMTENFLSGGTHYEKPLLTAIDIIDKEFEGTGRGRPDVLFMTDDEYTTMQPEFLAQWHKAKEKTSIKCYGIAIGCGASGALGAVSDNVRSVTEMVSDPKNVGDLFRSI